MTDTADLTRFADLVRGASLRGAPRLLTPSTTLRLGRAIGTVLRRQGQASTSVLIGRGHGVVDAAVRDGLVAGLVLAGLRVVDLGIVESDRFTAALRAGPAAHVRGADAWPAMGGVLVGSTGDSVGVMVFAGTRPLVGEQLVDVAAVAGRGAFVALAGGAVTVVDTALLPWPAAVVAEDIEDDVDLDDVADDDIHDIGVEDQLDVDSSIHSTLADT